MMKNKKGFTLAEIIISISIFSLLFITVYKVFSFIRKNAKSSTEKISNQIMINNFFSRIKTALKSAKINSIFDKDSDLLYKESRKSNFKPLILGVDKRKKSLTAVGLSFYTFEKFEKNRIMLANNIFDFKNNDIFYKKKIMNMKDEEIKIASKISDLTYNIYLLEEDDVLFSTSMLFKKKPCLFIRIKAETIIDFKPMVYVTSIDIQSLNQQRFLPPYYRDDMLKIEYLK